MYRFCNFPVDFANYTIVKYSHGYKRKLSQQVEKFLHRAGVGQEIADHVITNIAGTDSHIFFSVSLTLM